MIDSDNGESKSMAKIKKEDFQDVNKIWTKYDLVIYTSTLTAGVSFE